MDRETLTAAIKTMLDETPECLDRAVSEFQAKGHCEVCFYFDSKQDGVMTFIEPPPRVETDAIHKAFLRARETSPEPDGILVPNPDGLSDEELQKVLDASLKAQMDAHSHRVLRGEATA